MNNRLNQAFAATLAKRGVPAVVQGDPLVAACEAYNEIQIQHENLNWAFESLALVERHADGALVPAVEDNGEEDTGTTDKASAISKLKEKILQIVHHIAQLAKRFYDAVVRALRNLKAKYDKSAFAAKAKKVVDDIKGGKVTLPITAEVASYLGDSANGEPISKALKLDHLKTAAEGISRGIVNLAEVVFTPQPERLISYLDTVAKHLAEISCPVGTHRRRWTLLSADWKTSDSKAQMSHTLLHFRSQLQMRDIQDASTGKDSEAHIPASQLVALYYDLDKSIEEVADIAERLAYDGEKAYNEFKSKIKAESDSSELATANQGALLIGKINSAVMYEINQYQTALHHYTVLMGKVGNAKA